MNSERRLPGTRVESPPLDRWTHLVHGAFRLDEAPAHALPAAARDYLRSVLEVFPRELDPADDFEAYAVRRLAMSVLRVMQSPGRE